MIGATQEKERVCARYFPWNPGKHHLPRLFTCCERRSRMNVRYDWFKRRFEQGRSLAADDDSRSGRPTVSAGDQHITVFFEWKCANEFLPGSEAINRSPVTLKLLDVWAEQRQGMGYRTPTTPVCAFFGPRSGFSHDDGCSPASRLGPGRLVCVPNNWKRRKKWRLFKNENERGNVCR